MIGRRVCRRAG